MHIVVNIDQFRYYLNYIIPKVSEYLNKSRKWLANEFDDKYRDGYFQDIHGEKMNQYIKNYPKSLLETINRQRFCRENIIRV